MVFSKDRYEERRARNAAKTEGEEPVEEAPKKELYADKRARLDAAKAKDDAPGV